MTFVPIDGTALWAEINEEFVELVDLLEDGKLDWSPTPELWNTRGIFLHILLGRNFLMERVVQDGETTPNLMQEVQTANGIKDQMRLAWKRMAPFLSDSEKLARMYDVPVLYGGSRRLSGHWLAFDHLEHDIHHRADIYHYLGLLGIDHGEPDTLDRKFKRENDA